MVEFGLARPRLVPLEGRAGTVVWSAFSLPTHPVESSSLKFSVACVLLQQQKNSQVTLQAGTVSEAYRHADCYCCYVCLFFGGGNLPL